MAFSISNIITEKLFGHYDYNLVEDNAPNKDSSKFLILYGDNGSGKTTILKSLFYLLSPQTGSGHKSNLAKTKYKSITIILNNFISIRTYREEGSLIGSYYIEIKENEKVIHNVLISTDNDNLVHLSNLTDLNGFINLLRYIKDMNISIYYISDKRKLLKIDPKDYNPLINDDDLDKYNDKNLNKYLKFQESLISREKESEDSLLEPIILQVTNFIKEQSIVGSIKGEKDTNSIYKDIIKRISDYDYYSDIDTAESINRQYLLNDLGNLSEQSISYSKFGLVSPFEYDDFLFIKNITENSSDQKKAIIYKILEPYIDGMKAKFKALQNLYNLLYKFQNALTSYLVTKEVTINVNNGIRINHIKGDEISISDLSSGEKQLLLLFCHVLLVDKNSSIFIIDEPEISLNIKWQRRLLNTLIQLNEFNETQYIIASHSLEILSSHSNSVFQLKID